MSIDLNNTTGLEVTYHTHKKILKKQRVGMLLKLQKNIFLHINQVGKGTETSQEDNWVLIFKVIR